MTKEQYYHELSEKGIKTKSIQFFEEFQNAQMTMTSMVYGDPELRHEGKFFNNGTDWYFCSDSPDFNGGHDEVAKRAGTQYGWCLSHGRENFAQIDQYMYLTYLLIIGKEFTILKEGKGDTFQVLMNNERAAPEEISNYSIF